MTINFVRKVYLGWFVCDACSQKLDKHPFTVDDMTIYCDCGEKESMRLANARLKVPLERRDANNKII